MRRIAVWLVVGVFVILLGRSLLNFMSFLGDMDAGGDHPNQILGPRTSDLSDNELAKLFEQLVLFDERRMARQMLFRWNGPIRVKFAGNSIDIELEGAKEALRQAARISGLEIGSAHGFVDANLVIHFSDPGDVLIAAKRYGVRTSDLGTSHWGIESSRDDRKGSYVSSRIVVESNQGAAQLDCTLRHEIMHALGFAPHPEVNVASVLAPRTDLLCGDFTLIDKLLVRTLYDPRIPVGADVKLARVLSRNIIAELVEELRAGGDPDQILAHPNSRKQQ